MSEQREPCGRVERAQFRCVADALGLGTLADVCHGAPAVESKILEIQNQLQELKDRTDNARACTLELLDQVNNYIELSNSFFHRPPVQTVLTTIKERIEKLIRIMP